MRQATLLHWKQTQSQLQGESRMNLLITLQQKACHLKNPIACFQLSHWSMAPPHLREQGCQQGQALACMAWQRIQGHLHDPQKARTSELVFVHQELQVACQGDIAQACAHLAWLYWQGDGVESNTTQAQTYMQKACHLKAPQSCEKLKLMQSNDP